MLNGWTPPQFQVVCTLHDGLPVYACRVSVSHSNLHHIDRLPRFVSVGIHSSSLVNKTFLSRPRPRPRLFSQDQGKTFYFEIKTKSKTFCRSSELGLAAIRYITSTNAVISQIYTPSPVISTFCPSTMNKHSNHIICHHHVNGIIMSPLCSHL